MYRLDLGSGIVAFEIEGDADHVGSLDPAELVKQNWPPEVVENYRRYVKKSGPSGAEASSSDVVNEDASRSD